MVRREAGAAGMIADVGETQRPRVGDEQSRGSRDPSAAGRFAVCVSSSIPTGMNWARPVPGLVEHSECAVPGIDECHRGLDDAPENRVEVEVGPDASARRRAVGGGSAVPHVLPGTPRAYAAPRTTAAERQNGRHVDARLPPRRPRGRSSRSARAARRASPTSRSSAKPGPRRRATAASRQRIPMSPCWTCACPTATASRCAARSARVTRRSAA